jgi:hypothetical protein
MSKHINIALPYETSMIVACQMVEKLLRRVDYVLYSHDLDRWVNPYTVEFYMQMMLEQVSMNLISYNINVDNNPFTIQNLSAKL